MRRILMTRARSGIERESCHIRRKVGFEGHFTMINELFSGAAFRQRVSAAAGFLFAIPEA
jgi:hypothetical protein